MPIAPASTRSRRRRHQARVAVRGSSCSTRLGIQRRPSRNSTRVTTSTESWVSARSGAENHAKVMHSARPTTLSMASAARRWNLAWLAAPMAQAPAITHISTNSGVAGTLARSPQVSGTIKADARPARPAIASIANSCGCRRRVPSQRTSRRAASEARARAFSNRRLPSRPIIPGAPRPRRCLKALAKRR